MADTLGSWSVFPHGTGVVGIHAALVFPGSSLLLWERFHGLHAPSLYPPNPNTLVANVGQSELVVELDLAAAERPGGGEAFRVVHTESSPFCGGSVQAGDG
ncbi:hypothetical protein HK405_001591, partial [Cladochytrium tenue]